MYYSYHYSLLSEFERRNNQLNQNENIDVIKFCKKQSDNTNELEESRMLEKRVYNQFNQIEFINYIPIEVFKEVVKDLYSIYKKEIPFGDIKSFIKNNYDTFIYECEIISKNLEKGKMIWWDSLEDFHFYNYFESTYDYKMISWISKNNDDSHFYALYLKKIIEFLEIDLIDEIEVLERNSNIIIKDDNIIIKKPTKTILDFIHNVDDKVCFLDKLKTIFPTEKGQNIKAIITLLEQENILIIGGREFKAFYLELTNYFDRDLGSRQSINDVKFEDIHKSIIDPIQKKLNQLIIKYKTE